MFSMLAVLVPLLSLLVYGFTIWFFSSGNSKQLAAAIISPAAVLVGLIVGVVLQLLWGGGEPCENPSDALKQICSSYGFGSWVVPNISLLTAAFAGITLSIWRNFTAIHAVFGAVSIFSLVWIGAVFPVPTIVLWLVIALLTWGITEIGVRVFGKKAIIWFEQRQIRHKVLAEA